MKKRLWMIPAVALFALLYIILQVSAPNTSDFARAAFSGNYTDDNTTVIGGPTSTPAPTGGGVLRQRPVEQLPPFPAEMWVEATPQEATAVVRTVRLPILLGLLAIRHRAVPQVAIQRINISTIMLHGHQTMARPTALPARPMIAAIPKQRLVY